jgi:hypothetical protein
MPDITMCPGITYDGVVCGLRETCYRYKATPSEYCQSYFYYGPVDTADGQTCDYFWPIESKSQLKRINVQTK